MHTFPGGNVPRGKQPGWNLPGEIFRGGIFWSPKLQPIGWWDPNNLVNVSAAYCLL